jgi:hypothetical protein
LILDPSSQHKIARSDVRVAWIDSPKVVAHSGNEAARRLFLDRPAIAVEVAINS